MHDLVHQSLLTLQQNLQDLQSAKNQIDTVKNAAQQVVASVVEIQQQYETHLPQLLATLTQHNEKVLAQVAHDHKAMLATTAQQLLATSQATAQQATEQYQQIQTYLAQYQAVVELTTALNHTIKQIDFPQRFVSLEQTVQQIHEAVAADVAALGQVKQLNDEHLAAIQQAHQYYLSNFFEKSEQQFAQQSSHHAEQIQTTIQDFKILQQETDMVFQQQKQNFRLTLQQVEQQTAAVLLNVKQSTETSAQKIENSSQQLQQSLVQQQTAIQQNIAAQQADIQQFVNAYQGLVTYTKTVESKLTSIDFPQKLTHLNTQLTVLEGKIEEQLIEVRTDLKASLTQQFAEIDLKLNLQRKQSENYFQLIENQQQRIFAQQEQAQRHLQQHISETQEVAAVNQKVQLQLLQSQLDIQNKQLQYLLFGLISIGVFAVVHLLWSLFKGE